MYEQHQPEKSDSVDAVIIGTIRARILHMIVCTG